MSKVAVYSTHNYTASIANQLRRLDVHYVEAASNEAFLTVVADEKFDLIVLDSSSERAIFEIMKTIDHEPANKHTSILFLVPGKICYEQEMTSVSDRAILGLSKPFSPKEFANLVNFLVHKKKQHDKIELSLTELRQFTVMASHDLKTPIKNVYSYADILLEEIEESSLDIDEEIVEYVNIIRSESKRMIAFVNDMFEFSNAGHVKLDVEAFDLRKFVLDVYTMIENEYGDRNVSLKLEDIPNEFHGDKTKLGHIFQNLIENAVKYSDPDTPLTISIRAHQRNTMTTTFCVEDDGNGVRPQDIGKIFLPFKRGLTKVKGTGIGLAIVKKLIDAHDGEIWVESVVGQGSQFHFTLRDMTKKDFHHEAA